MRFDGGGAFALGDGMGRALCAIGISMAGILLAGCATGARARRHAEDYVFVPVTQRAIDRRADQLQAEAHYPRADAVARARDELSRSQWQYTGEEAAQDEQLRARRQREDDRFNGQLRQLAEFRSGS